MISGSKELDRGALIEECLSDPTVAIPPQSVRIFDADENFLVGLH